MTAVGVIVAAVLAFFVSFTYYSSAPAGRSNPQDLADQPQPTGARGTQAGPQRTSGARPEPWQVAAELLRSAAVAGLVTGLVRSAGWHGAGTGTLLGLALWVLPVVLLAGSVMWEAVPVRTGALHAGDWLIKLAAIGAVVGAFA